MARPTRRDFMKAVTACSLGAGLSAESFLRAWPCTAAELTAVQKDAGGLELSFSEAMHYKKLPDRVVQCQICPRQCSVANKERGYCGVRLNEEGTYRFLAHSRACSVHIDPIEKKPLFHVIPRSPVFSLATAGCNMMCKFCQNWQISQARPELLRNFLLTPEMIIDQCLTRKVPGIAFTYSEPVVFYEYMYDTARLAKQKGVKSVMISNGYILPEPMRDLARYLDAVKIDFKAFSEKFYREVCSAHLEPVLENLKTLAGTGIWFELVYLVIPTLNDDLDSIRDMSRWLLANLGPDVPLHFTRFYPQYQLANLPPTPVTTLEKARNIAREAGINYVYVGNVPASEGEHTWCPRCKKAVVKRRGYVVMEMNLTRHDESFVCSSCKHPIPGHWQ